MASYYRPPGISFEAVAQWEIPGLVGTLGVTVFDGIGGTTIPRTTSGIVEVDTGVYVATITAPTTVGDYSIVFDDGTDFAGDTLTVTGSAVVPVGPTGTGMSLGEILDAVMLDRFETAQRPRALQAVQIRMAHLWALEDWTFKFATVNVTALAGTQVIANTPNDMGVPLYLWDDQGYQLPYLNTDHFYRRYLPANTGWSEAWTVTNQQIIVGPTPTSTSATWTLHYRKRLTQVTDETDVPDWPAEFSMAIVHGAGADLRVAYDDIYTAGEWENLFSMDLDAMRREYLADAQGQPETWNSDLAYVGSWYGY